MTGKHISPILRVQLLLFILMLLHSALPAQNKLVLPEEIRKVVEILPEKVRDSAYIAVGQQHYRIGTGEEYNIAFSCYMEALSYATRFDHSYQISRCYFHLGGLDDTRKSIWWTIA